MKLQRDSYAPKSCAFDAANVQFLRAHLCKSHPVLQHAGISDPDDELPILEFEAKLAAIDDTENL